VNVEIKSKARRTDITRAAVSRPVGPAVHELTGGVADTGDWRRVQPTRGAKRRAVSYAAVDSGSDSVDLEWVFAAPRRRRRKAARVTQVTTGFVQGRLVPPEEDVVWEQHLASLRAYKCRHGDCNVPRSWAEEPPLGNWINMQRVRKKQLDRGEPCRGMTAARAAKLEALGFAWELSAAAISKQASKANRDDAGWAAQLVKLEAYKCRHGDCNVPTKWAEDPPLGRWVGNQRQSKKALERGEPCRGMTAARSAKLEALGFAWAPSRR
jgi:hypothetical protein